jgi:hypothetical protein
MAAKAQDKSMMIVWAVGAVLAILGIYLAIPGTPQKTSMTGGAPEPQAETMPKQEMQQSSPATPSEKASPASPTEKSQ